MMILSNMIKGLGVVALAVALMSGTASADVVDLTVAGNSGTLTGSVGGDALFVQILPRATGTGLIDSFAEITGNELVREAYNTTVNGVLDNGSADNFNHSITLSQVPVVEIEGDFYRQFMLDINENNNKALDQFLALDALTLYAGGDENPSTEDLTDTGILGSIVWEMADDDWVALNYALNTGSGSGDMFFYVPLDAFDGIDDDDVITLYSSFGGTGDIDAGELAELDHPDAAAGNYANSDGFEEWAVLIGGGPPVVPEPFSVSLMMLGLTGIAFVARRRKGL